MVVKICSGVYLVAAPFLTSELDAYSYAVIFNDEAILIDSGSGMNPIGVLRNILELGISVRNLRYIVNTHAHADHAGGDYFFYNNLNSTIVAMEPDAMAIRHGNEDYTASKMLGVPFKPCPVGISLEKEYYELRVGSGIVELYRTPGHTAGSMSILVEVAGGRVLFGGDCDGVLCSKWNSDEKDWRRSIEKILSMEFDILCMGHWYKVNRGREILEKLLEKEPMWID